ncbi:porin [Blastopirellula marina]|uniref:Porin n=1 Tax=Blastopirellula marina TaxID=124 RepID=A0A2S8GUS9_9BACT|nr:porin [Blastopirellula marina]PQO48166.1 porin [Blastopirellula marina]
MKLSHNLQTLAWSVVLGLFLGTAAEAQTAKITPVPRAGSARQASANSRPITVHPAKAAVQPASSVIQQTSSVEEMFDPTVGTIYEQTGCASCGTPGCSSCSLGSMCGLGWGDPCCSPWFIKGWLDQGFTGNPDTDGGENGPAGTNGPLIFNDQANEYMLNQLYLSMGRNVSQDPYCWDIGGRVDVMFGTDYFFVQAQGLETRSDNSQHWNSGNGPRNAGNAGLYGLALPQFYVEGNVPWGNGLNVKAGHFYTIMGYESVMAPENFFYSHSYTMQYGEPFTHTGIMLSYPTSSCMTWYGGVVRGWNNFEQPNGQVSYLGGFRWVSPHEATKLNFSIITGSQDPTGENNRTAYSLVFQQQINQCWTYVLEHNFGTEQNGRLKTDFTLGQATWASLSNYLYYSYNPCLDLGARFEWFGDPDNARVFGLSNDNISDGGNYYALTLGANYHPNGWFVLRPEVRWDYSDFTADGFSGAFNNGTSKDQFTIGFDLITMF